MKGLIILACLIPATAEAKKIVLDIPDDEIAVVETYVPDAETWLREAWAGKVNNRREALIKDEVQDSVEKGRAVPAKKQDIIKNGMKRMGTRKKRDAEQKKKEDEERKKREAEAPVPN